jgi:signal peptidase I
MSLPRLSPSIWVLIAFLIALAVAVNIGGVLFAIFPQETVARVFRVPTKAMAPAINPGDQILMSSWALHNGLPRLGEVVVFRTEGIEGLEKRPAEWLVKRVAGLPGDIISIHAGNQLRVNGVPVDGFPPVSYNPGGEFLAYDGDSYTVPPNSYFVLGDDSQDSYDSRFWGCVPADNIKGRAILIFWPPTRMGLIK